MFFSDVLHKTDRFLRKGDDIRTNHRKKARVASTMHNDNSPTIQRRIEMFTRKELTLTLAALFLAPSSYREP